MSLQHGVQRCKRRVMIQIILVTTPEFAEFAKKPSARQALDSLERKILTLKGVKSATAVATILD